MLLEVGKIGRIRIGYTEYGQNLYKVIESKEGFYLIECIEFHRKEETGDLTCCESLGQWIWVYGLEHRWQDSYTLADYMELPYLG